MWYQRDAEGFTLYLYIQPGAKKTEIAGIHDHQLKIRLHAPPIEWRANKEVLRYVAEIFQVPLRQVTLKRGNQSRHKVLTVTGSSIDPDTLL